MTSEGALILAGVAFGASSLLGSLAPPFVKDDLAAVDQGMPPDLRPNPDAEHASLVASAKTSFLYAATLRYVITRSDSSDFTKAYGISGHVSAAGATKLELDYGDDTGSIPIQSEGTYEYPVPPERRRVPATAITEHARRPWAHRRVDGRGRRRLLAR